MSALENKQLVESILVRLSEGDYEFFFDSMADGMTWTWMGSGDLSKTFRGKSSVVNELWGSVRTSLKQPYQIRARRLIAEGEIVVVEAEGQNSTVANKPYNNKYCWICRILGGKLVAVSEYMDTHLVKETF